jgi:phosphonopyruvate decarboxylase
MIEIADAMDVIAEERGERIVVATMSGLGFVGEPRELDFRLLGLMGAAGSIGVGLAIGQAQRDVWVIDGDGSLLMQLGVLTAVGDAAPRRFHHILFANGVYAISGAQSLPARGRLDWEMLALSAGYRSATTCSILPDLRRALRSGAAGPRLLVVACRGGRPAYPDGAFAFDASGEAARLRAALQRSRVPV